MAGKDVVGRGAGRPADAAVLIDQALTSGAVVRKVTPVARDAREHGLAARSRCT
jgi:hypothetical protein